MLLIIWKSDLIISICVRRIEIHTNYIHGLLCMKLKLDDTSYRALAGLMRWLRGENNQRLYALCKLGVKNQLHTDQDSMNYSKFN